VAVSLTIPNNLYAYVTLHLPAIERHNVMAQLKIMTTRLQGGHRSFVGMGKTLVSAVRCRGHGVELNH
jgi:hypothetical protein